MATSGIRIGVGIVFGVILAFALIIGGCLGVCGLVALGGAKVAADRHTGQRQAAESELASRLPPAGVEAASEIAAPPEEDVEPEPQAAEEPTASPQGLSDDEERAARRMLMTAEVFIGAKRYESARRELQKVIDRWPESDFAADAREIVKKIP